MKDKGFNRKDTFIVGVFIGFVFTLILIVWQVGPHNYKRGQVDALTGKVKYEMVVHEDSTLTWEKIPEK